jgi:hypothetical protein
MNLKEHINIAVLQFSCVSQVCTTAEKKGSLSFLLLCVLCVFLHFFPLHENLDSHFCDFVCRRCQAERLRFLAPSPLSSPVAALVTGKGDGSMGDLRRP